MIETPGPRWSPTSMARVADFFSFGTNDLTQMTFGFSRDDVEAKMMPEYVAQGLLPGRPVRLDRRRTASASWSAMAVERGRSVKRRLKIGVCGEHGGDPASIAFFVAAGVDYVSCSPFRVPIARLAAAHAVIGHGRRHPLNPVPGGGPHGHRTRSASAAAICCFTARKLSGVTDTESMPASTRNRA